MARYRLGFVSNSSSSSFLIVGLGIEDTDEIRDLLATKGNAEDEELDDYSLFERLMEKPEAEGLEHFGNGDYGHYLGASWDSVKDYETGLEFKNRVKAQLEKLLGKSVKCGTHKEAWYNG